MTLPPGLPGFEFLTAEEAALLASVARGNEWLRAVLCTLARRGVAYRQSDPRRAQELLRTLAPLPYYKGGQFLFDLMEWEDFMLDGPPPPVVPTTLDERSLSRVTALLVAVQQHFDGSLDGEGQPRTAADQTPVDDDNLPPVEPGLYLYQDVVLGIVVSVLRSRPSSGPEPEPEEPRPSAWLRLSLDPPQAEVAPGEQEMLQLAIRNRQKTEEQGRLEVEGLPDGWYSAPAGELVLPPDSRSRFLLYLHPPRTSASAARAYPFTVTLTSTTGPARSVSIASTLLIQPFDALYVEVQS
jgi:hypothetical protein